MHVGIDTSQRQWKSSRHFWRMPNLQFCVSGKRPIEDNRQWSGSNTMNQACLHKMQRWYKQVLLQCIYVVLNFIHHDIVNRNIICLNKEFTVQHIQYNTLSIYCVPFLLRNMRLTLHSSQGRARYGVFCLLQIWLLIHCFYVEAEFLAVGSILLYRTSIYQDPPRNMNIKIFIFHWKKMFVK